MRHVTKAFPGALALDGVSLALERGEVRALAGENGAGKSTLMKLLAGLEQPDSGEILFDGRRVALRSPHDALRLGISMIHQELMPFLDLTVAENIMMGREPARFGVWLDRAAMLTESRALLERTGASIDPGRRMRELSVAGMQMVEIAKALGNGSRLLIMDEPTSALSGGEVDKLLALVRGLQSEGVAVIYITHRMAEMFRIAGTVTVLRDGRHVETGPMPEFDEDRLIRCMAGRSLDAIEAPVPLAPAAGPLLEVRGLARKGRFANVSFTLARGEIVGVAGLMGAGRTDLVCALFGLAPADAGEVRIDGRAVRLRSPSDAMSNGIALVTEDRKGSGLIPKMTVRENVTLAALRRFCRGPFIDTAAESTAAAGQVRALGIKAASLEDEVEHLSGGNQQKTVLAKALLTGPSILMLDEPTRGIDVGAKAEIYAILRRLAAEGKAILVVSSELTEILALTHRVLVMREGRIAACLATRETTAEEVLRHAMPQ